MSRGLLNRVALLLVLLIATPACNNRSAGNEDIFAELEGDDSVYIFKIPVVLFNGIAAQELTSGENLEEMGDIKVVKLLIFDQNNAKKKTSGEISKLIVDRLNEIGYEQFINVSSGGMATSAYVLENDNNISDLMVVVTENESVIGIGLSGKLNFKSIAQFASNLDYSNLKSYNITD